MEKRYIVCITPNIRKNKKFALTNKSKLLLDNFKELID